MFCRKLTAPQSLFLSIIQASKVTLPSLSGSPPYPTDLSSGLSSESLTPYSTAVNPPSPFFKSSQAILLAGTPCFQVEIILGPGFEFFIDNKLLLKLPTATDPTTPFFIKFLLFNLYIIFRVLYFQHPQHP